jgi:hypothetical protein
MKFISVHGRGINVCYRSKTPKCALKSGDSRVKNKFVSPDEFIFDELEEKGRLQFFFHLPSSELPVRDVLDEQGQGHKTEPHIEIGAENYIFCCYQSNNIVPFLKSKERYLFLFTTCKNKKFEKFYGKRFIVGYMVKQSFIYCNCRELIKQGYCDNCAEQQHYGVRGETKIFRFEDAYPLEKLVENSKQIRIRKVSIDETKEILEYFKWKQNVLKECVEEIKDKDKDNRTCKYGDTCKFRRECLRF